MGREDLILEALVLGLVLSIGAFLISELFKKKKTLVQAGSVSVNTHPPFDFDVRYVVPYRQPPNLTLVRHNHIRDALIYTGREREQFGSDAEYMAHFRNDENWYEEKYQAFNAVVRVQDERHFEADIIPNPHPDEGRAERFEIPVDATVEWKAEGLVEPSLDSRSPWMKLSTPQRAFSVSGALFALGIVADFAGIFGLFVR